MHLLTALLLALASPLPGAGCVSTGNAEAAPSQASPLVVRGMEHLLAGKLDLALAEVDKAIRIDPSFALAYFARGHVHGLQGHFTGAISEYDHALDLNPNFAAAYASKGFACQAAGRFVEAAKAYREFLARASPESCRDDIERAKSALSQLTNGETCKMYLVQGQLALGQGKTSEAIARLDEGIELIPMCWILYDYRGMAHHNAGDYEQAIADYDRSIALNPKYPMPYLHKAWTCDKAGRISEALAACRQFIDVADPRKYGGAIEQARRIVARLEGSKE